MTTMPWQNLSGGALDDLFGAADSDMDFGDRYTITETLGRGGQGVVFLAHDKVLERSVAIKHALDPQNGSYLYSEAALLGQLAHPAIPAIYDRGRAADGSAFFVMQYIESQPLHTLLKDGLGDDAARLRLIRSVAGAVGHAHSRGILHRDLKPSNILVNAEGEPYLVDWGLAATGDPRAVCGSPCYAAPEQLQGQVADKRSDIYALGVLLYEVLTGKLPYVRPVHDFDEFRRLRAGLGHVPLHDRRKDLPAALGRVIERAMAAQPAARYPSTADFLADLDAVAAGRPLATDPSQIPWRLPAACVALLSLVLVAFIVGRMSSPVVPVTAQPIGNEPNRPQLPEEPAGVLTRTVEQADPSLHQFGPSEQPEPPPQVSVRIPIEAAEEQREPVFEPSPLSTDNQPDEPGLGEGDMLPSLDDIISEMQDNQLPSPLLPDANAE